MALCLDAGDLHVYIFMCVYLVIRMVCIHVHIFMCALVQTVAYINRIWFLSSGIMRLRLAAMHIFVCVSRDEDGVDHSHSRLVSFGIMRLRFAAGDCSEASAPDL
jgi:hypothetical protein